MDAVSKQNAFQVTLWENLEILKRDEIAKR